MPALNGIHAFNIGTKGQESWKKKMMRADPTSCTARDKNKRCDAELGGSVSEALPIVSIG